MKKVTSRAIKETAVRLSPDIVKDVRDNITKQMVTFIENRIVDNFPKDLDRVCEKFFELEVTPQLMAFLKKHKAEIIRRVKDKIVELAAQKIIKDFARALERKEFDFDDLDD